MTPNDTNIGWGVRVFGLGIVASAAVGIVSRKFVPAGIPAHDLLATAAAAFVLAGGAAMLWRRTAAWGSVAVTTYFALVFVVLMDGRLFLAHYAQYGVYENLAEHVAIVAAGLIVYATHAKLAAASAARLSRLGQILFGLCAVIFGGAHFVYMNLTAPLVPLWLPPDPLFWGYATGVAHIAGGVAILIGLRARLAALLLTAMYASFIPLVWAPVLLADPSNIGRWNECAVTLALAGCAWVVADSLAHRS